MIEKFTVHRRRAKAFYDTLREEEDSDLLKLSFGCQKNLVLPRVPDQTAYYSRQIRFLANGTITHNY